MNTPAGSNLHGLAKVTLQVVPCFSTSSYVTTKLVIVTYGPRFAQQSEFIREFPEPEPLASSSLIGEILSFRVHSDVILVSEVATWVSHFTVVLSLDRRLCGPGRRPC